ncbi:hypothetical protein P4V41_07665 [Fictibacillus nanhaiensis]|uniref:hypothetical protein n=1 Tax=Fictibacillus nanhaiensis TaxID=742169 RepID=UPI002E1F0392|nr:hypothetical protein [Fictibacillus nanhaiensis]
MFGLRIEFRHETQKAYGKYCSHTRGNGKEPIPYHLFSDYYSKGLTIKEIFQKVNVR